MDETKSTTQVEETPKEEQAEPEVIVDYEGQCPSLTGRSELTYQAGRDPRSNEPLLRIARNSGGGMACKDWAPVAHIDAVLAKANPVTARSFDEIHPGRSINTGGFLLAIVKDLGVVQPKEDNGRHHELVPGGSVMQALSDRIVAANTPDSATKTRRKGKGE